MKTEVKATELKSALKSMMALQYFGKERSVDERSSGCLMTVTEDDELVLESASSGAYLRRRLAAKTLQPGSAGIDAAKVLQQNLAGDVSLDARNGMLNMVYRKTAKGTLPISQDVEQSIIDSRPVDDFKKLAQIPYHLLNEAVSIITYPPGIKEETISVQLRVRKGKKGAILDISGVDEYGYAWYRTTDADIRTKRDFDILLSSDLLKRIMAEIAPSKKDDASAVVRIGYNEDDQLARFASDDFVLYHPILDEEWTELAGMIEGNLDFWFEATVPALSDAVNTVGRLDTGQDPLVLQVGFKKKKILRIESKFRNQEIQQDVEVTKSAPPKRKSTVVNISEMYFSNFLKRTPKEFPVRVEAWNESMIRMVATNTGTKKIEFMVVLMGG